MIKNSEYINKFETDFLAKEKISFEQALKIVDSLWDEAVALKVLPLKDPLEGIDVDIRIARILNLCSKKLL